MTNKNLLAVAFELKGPGIVPDLESPGIPVENLISQIIGVLTIVGAIFFIFQIIFAGYAMISSQGDPKKIEVARSRLTNGILGLTIVVVALGVGAFIATLLGIRDPLNIQNILPIYKG